MPRLPKEKIILIKELTRKGASLNWITRAIGAKKTSVYHHFLKVRGKTYQKPRIHFESGFDEGEAVGIFAGDGSYSFVPAGYHYLVRVHLGNEAYAAHVKRLFEKSFGKKFFVTREGNRVIVQTVSKSVYEFFASKLLFEPKRKAPAVKLKTMKHSPDFFLGFLRGLTDTDGTVAKNGRVTVYTTSEDLAKQTSAVFSKLGFENSIYKGGVRPNGNYPLYHVNVKRAYSIEFNKKVGLHKPFRGLVDQR